VTGPVTAAAAADTADSAGGARGRPLVLGTNTCFAVKRWPEPDRWAAIVAGDLGMDECQVTLDLMDPGLAMVPSAAYAAAVRQACEAAGVAVHSLFTGLAAYSSNLLLHPEPAMREAAHGWFERAIELGAVAGARGVGGYLGALSVADAADPARRRSLMAELGTRLQRLAGAASAAGLDHLQMENMAVRREPGSVIEEMHELEALAAGSAVPWVLCLDLGHPCALRTGTRSDDPLAWLGERWAHPPVLQIQQANRDGDHHWPFTDERNAEGLLSAGPVLSALAAAGGGPGTGGGPTAAGAPGAGAPGAAGSPDEAGPGPVHAFFEVIHPPEADDGAVLADLRRSAEHWRAAIAGRQG
jgi:sugar phosphate isomerase/epimerase